MILDEESHLPQVCESWKRFKRSWFRRLALDTPRPVTKFCHRLTIDEQPTGYDGKTDCYSPSFTVSNFASSDVMLTEGRDEAGYVFPLLWAEVHWGGVPP